MFSISSLRLYFPVLEAWGCVVCLAPSLFLPVYLRKCGTAGSASRHLARPGPPATALPRVLSAQLSTSTSPAGLDECFFFNSLVVGLPYSLIFCQLWLFFVFKFVVDLLLVVRGGTVCLPMPPSWPEVCMISFEVP